VAPRSSSSTQCTTESTELRDGNTGKVEWNERVVKLVRHKCSGIILYRMLRPLVISMGVESSTRTRTCAPKGANGYGSSKGFDADGLHGYDSNPQVCNVSADEIWPHSSLFCLKAEIHNPSSDSCTC
jgi:hypothetical protein